MPQLEVTLRPRRSSPLKTVAWYLPGADTRAWLDEIARWPVEHQCVRLVVIAEPDNRSVAGAVAIPALADFPVSGWCVPLGKLHGDVYLPVDAEFYPEITQREAAQLFADASVYAFLPGRGLTKASLDEVLSVSTLLSIPPQAETEWGRAEPGIAFPDRLVGIFPLEALSVQDVLDDGRDDIGQQADEIAKLPKSPDEPLSGMAGAVGRAAVTAAAMPILGLEKLVAAVGKLIPSGGGGAGSMGAGSGSSVGAGHGMFSAIGDFANNMLDRVAKSLEATRNKEIGRLLHMLESNPDEGLKFAIPFGGGEHRGRAAPGSRLGARKVDFRLGGLGGGGPADVWDLPWEYQQQLIARYRELAARETRLGRHRRAAYIYGDLLGDMKSAASALEQGRHFREAAVLYRDRLKQPLQAAECLERGELWNEAIEGYRGLKKHEKVGDLLSHIDQQEAAAVAYHAAAEELRDKHDWIGASRVYVERLRDADLALALLDSSWPEGPQASKCVRASFGLRSRLGRHGEAVARIDDLRHQAEKLARHAEVAELLADAHQEYSEASVQEHARRRSHQLVTSRMQDADVAEASRLVRVYSRITPEDRLLPRDGLHYVEQKQAAAPALRIHPPAKAPHTAGCLRLTRTVDLGQGGCWRAAAALQGVVYVAGVWENRIALARCGEGRQVEKCFSAWPKTPLPTDTRLVLLGERDPLHLFAVGFASLPISRVFHANDAMALEGVSVGGLAGVSAVWGVASGTLGQTWAVENRDDPALVCVGGRGRVVATQSLLPAADAAWDFAATPLPMHATSRQVLLGVGSRLLSVKGTQFDALEEFPSRIVGIAGGRQYAADRIVVSLETGAALLRLGFGGCLRPFAEELQSPQVLLSQGGYVIAADEHRLQVWRPEGKRPRNELLELVGELDHSHGCPIAILPTPLTNQFKMVTEAGAVGEFEIDR